MSLKKRIKKTKVPKATAPIKEVDEPVAIPEINDRASVGYTSGDNFNFGEEREFKNNPVASKYAFDLFDESKAVAAPLIRVKHIRAPNKADRWKIFNNNKVIFILEGSKLLKKEREFLHTVSGVQTLLALGKTNDLTIVHLKKELKGRLK
jgi:hypothetical protein